MSSAVSFSVRVPVSRSLVPSAQATVPNRVSLSSLPAETVAVAQGLREKAEEFRKGGGELYVSPQKP